MTSIAPREIAPAVDATHACALLHQMLRIRRLEERCADLYKAEKIRGFLHLYIGEEERYRKCFVGGWYLTGDLARRDADGYYWFVGRADDVIKSSGHLIGPFEVESTLLEHPAVAEAAVIGKPDPVAGEIVKAFVSLKAGVTFTDALRLELLGFARTRLGAAVAPKEIAWLEQVPRTRSGKIMRRLLRARELGLPEGDLSTLEGPSS